MNAKKGIFDITINKHYFHFIAIRDTGGYKINDFWRQVGNVHNSKQKNIIYSDFEIQHKKLKSNYPYPRGSLLKTTSISGEGNAPYLYDLFALRVNINKESYFIFAFPFAALARNIIDNLINKHNLIKKSDIIKVHLPKLIQMGNSDVEKKHFQKKIVQIHVVCVTDPDLSSLSIGGDNPLKSSLYREFILDSIEKKVYTPDKCVLACELQWPLNNNKQPNEKTRPIHTRMHIDSFGNFKFYIHIGADNLLIIPYLLKTLRALKCLDKVDINPLLRVQMEE